MFLGKVSGSVGHSGKVEKTFFIKGENDIWKSQHFPEWQSGCPVNVNG